MATIVVSFDTVEKTLSVTKDGAEMANCVGVNFGRSYRDDDEFMCSVTQCEQDEENDTRTYTNLCANEKGELVRREDVKSVADDVVEYLAKPGPKPRGAK